MEENKNGLVFSEKSLHLFAGAGGVSLEIYCSDEKLLGQLKSRHTQEKFCSQDRQIKYCPISQSGMMSLLSDWITQKQNSTSNFYNQLKMIYASVEDFPVLWQEPLSSQIKDTGRLKILTKEILSLLTKVIGNPLQEQCREIMLKYGVSKDSESCPLLQQQNTLIMSGEKEKKIHDGYRSENLAMSSMPLWFFLNPKTMTDTLKTGGGLPEDTLLMVGEFVEKAGNTEESLLHVMMKNRMNLKEESIWQDSMQQELRNGHVINITSQKVNSTGTWKNSEKEPEEKPSQKEFLNFHEIKCKPYGMDICQETEEGIKSKPQQSLRHYVLALLTLPRDWEWNVPFTEQKDRIIAKLKEDCVISRTLILSDTKATLTLLSLTEKASVKESERLQTQETLEQFTISLLLMMNHILQTEQSYTTAKICQLQANKQGLMENVQDFGLKCSESLAKYDQSISLWRTHQCSLFEDLIESQETFPKSGMTVNGQLWELMMLTPHTKEKDYGLPDVENDNWGGQINKITYPTPTAHDEKGCCNPYVLVRKDGKSRMDQLANFVVYGDF